MGQEQALPQLGGEVFLTDGGLETDLIFHHGVDLPSFASFPLHDDPDGLALLRDYFADYVRIGEEHGFGLVLETATWRANRDWGDLLGYDAVALRDVNRSAVELVAGLGAAADTTVVVSGCLGPRGDAYTDLGSMSDVEAEEYHQPQIDALADAGVDLVGAYTLTNVDEAVGIVRAAGNRRVPVAVSFTVETDGRLPDSTALGDAVAEVDRRTGAAAAYFLVNCAHPDHLSGPALDPAPAIARVRGVRANASRQSHAELDESTELDDGDPGEFGELLAQLHGQRGTVSILGGCCGTDRRHVEQVARTLRGSG